MDQEDIEDNISGLWQEWDELRSVGFTMSEEEFHSIIRKWFSLPHEEQHKAIISLLMLTWLKDEDSKQALLEIVDNSTRRQEIQS